LYVGEIPVIQEKYVASNKVETRFNLVDSEQRVLGQYRMVYGTGESLRFFYLDHLGSRRVVINSAGTVVDKFSYSEWGVGVQDSGSDIDLLSFTGKEYDDSGLIYFNARYYDPTTGRFLTEDPSRQGSNWYAYCGNNPINMTDPDGRDPPQHKDWTGGGGTPSAPPGSPGGGGYTGQPGVPSSGGAGRDPSRSSPAEPPSTPTPPYAPLLPNYFPPVPPPSRAERELADGVKVLLKYHPDYKAKGKIDVLVQSPNEDVRVEGQIEVLGWTPEEGLKVTPTPIESLPKTGGVYVVPAGDEYLGASLSVQITGGKSGRRYDTTLGIGQPW
jgi:RHS repeat-associated protein